MKRISTVRFQWRVLEGDRESFPSPFPILPLSVLLCQIIMQQLVEAAIELHSQQVFHRDIKLENILLETGADVLRVRMTDFGCGCFARKGHYRLFSGMMFGFCCFTNLVIFFLHHSV